MICRICKKNKDLKYFGNNKNKPNGKNNFCKKCKKNIDKISYVKRKDILSIKKRDKRNNFKIEYDKLKFGKKCLKCGETKPYILDFHHINEKEFNVGHKAWQSLNIEKIKKEVEKCILLCSNHHREFHYLEKTKNITLDNYINS